MNQVINKSVRYLLKGITPETKTSKAAGHCKETHECPSKGGEKAQNRGAKSATGGSISLLFIRSTTAERLHHDGYKRQMCKSPVKSTVSQAEVFATKWSSGLV